MKLLLCAAFLLLPCGVYAQTAPAPGGTPGSPTILGATNIIAEATSSTGAYASFTVTASDTDSSSLTAVCNPLSGSLFALGSTSVTCIAESIAAPGTSTSASFVVSVVDTTVPSFSILPLDQSFATTTFPAEPALTFPTVSDLVDPAPTLTYAPQQFALGTTTVIWTVVDASGNSASTTSTVVITETPPAPVPEAAPVSVVGGNGPPVGFLPAPVNAPAPSIQAPPVTQESSLQYVASSSTSSSALPPTQPQIPETQTIAEAVPPPQSVKRLAPIPEEHPAVQEGSPQEVQEAAQVAAAATVAPARSIDYIGLLILLLFTLIAIYSEWRRDKRKSR